MRNAFAENQLYCTKIKKIVLLSGDIGNRLFDNFRKNFQQDFTIVE